MRNEELAKLLRERAYQTKPEGEYFELASGRKSREYFNCKRVTMFAQAMPLIGSAFLSRFEELDLDPDAVGGLTAGADPIALSIAYSSLQRSQGPIEAFFVRKDRKEHGTRNWIEGCADRGAKIVVVDDVITAGGSIIQAIERCEESGLVIIGCFVLLDRCEGGMDRLRRRLPNVPVESILLKTDLDARRDSHRT